MAAIVTLLNDSGRWLVAQLGRMSIELAILAGIVLVAMYVLRVKSPALRHLFWGLLLAKPVVTFLVASPLSLYAFLWPPIPEFFTAQAPVVVEMQTAPMAPPVQSVSAPSSLPATELPRVEPPPVWRKIDRYGIASALWILVASALALRLLLGCAYVAFLQSTALTQREGPLAKLVAEAGTPLRMRRGVRIATTRVAHGPVLAGIFRPIILLPESMAWALTPKQLKLVITHELAHAKRWDNLVLLVQRFAEMFFFFHPVVWFCGWMMRREAEAACDDMVVSAYGDEDGAGAAAYADSLTRVAEMKCGITHRLLVNTFAAAESNFNRRIRRILSGRRGRMTLWLSLATGAALVLIGVLGLPTVTSAPSLEPSQYAAASFSDLKSLYAKQVPVLAPEIRRYREESPAFQAWRKAMQVTMPIVVRGEKARRQLVQIYAEGKQDPKSLGPEFQVDPKDGDVIGHPLIDRVAKTVFQKTWEEALKVLAPGSDAEIELTRGMQQIKDAAPLPDPGNYKNPYEEGSFAAISLDRAMGESMMLLALRSGKVYQPLPAPLEEKLRTANALYEIMKTKASPGKQKLNLPQRIDPVDAFMEQMVAAKTETLSNEESPRSGDSDNANKEPRSSAIPEAKSTQSLSEAALTPSSITPPSAAPQNSVATANIERDLDASSSIEFENIHLWPILQYISETTGTLSFSLDWRVVEVPGYMSTNANSIARGWKPAPVTSGIVPSIDIRDKPWREILDALLRPLRLTFVVKEHYIWISSPAMIEADARRTTPEPNNPDPKLMKALGAISNITFADIDIRDLLEFCSESYDVPIVVDDTVVAPKASSAAAAAGDTSRYVTNGFVPIVKLLDMPVLDLLEAVLRPLDLVAVVENNQVRVTSYDRAGGDKAAMLRAPESKAETAAASNAPPPGASVVVESILVLGDKPILARVRIRGAETWVRSGDTRGGYRFEEFTFDPLGVQSPSVLLIRQADNWRWGLTPRQGAVRTELSAVPDTSGLKLLSIQGPNDKPRAQIQHGEGSIAQWYFAGCMFEDYVVTEIDAKAGTVLVTHESGKNSILLRLPDAPPPPEATPDTAAETDGQPAQSPSEETAKPQKQASEQAKAADRQVLDTSNASVVKRVNAGIVEGPIVLDRELVLPLAMWDKKPPEDSPRLRFTQEKDDLRGVLHLKSCS